MLRAPIPDVMRPSIHAITPQWLRQRGIRLLLLDLDNTLVPYEDSEPNPALLSWLRSMEEADIEPFIFSNNRGGRPADFAQKLGIGFIGKAKKPNPRRLWALLEEKGVAREQAVLVGDQIYTDIYCARRGGILAVAVHPIRVSKPHRALRYAAEAPWRLMARIRGDK